METTYQEMEVPLQARRARFPTPVWPRLNLNLDHKRPSSSLLLPLCSISSFLSCYRATLDSHKAFSIPLASIQVLCPSSPISAYFILTITQRCNSWPFLQDIFILSQCQRVLRFYRISPLFSPLYSSPAYVPY